LGLIELTVIELENIEGGIIETAAAAAALWGALYGFGYACGSAYYHYTH
jgi:lactobin A/cerein 7B family class IIb bacteriocin